VVHCHGAVGVSANDPDLDTAGARRIAAFKAQHGKLTADC